MSEELHYKERIDNYLIGLMSEEESGIFEQEMKRDNMLLKNVEFRRDLISGIQKYGDTALENTLTEIEIKLNNEGFFLNEEHIRQYLTDELDPVLKETFEKRLRADEAFAKEVGFHKSLLHGIERLGEQTDNSMLSNIEEKLAKEVFFESKKESEKEEILTVDGQEKTTDSEIVSLFSRRLMAIAASILIILTLSVYYLIRPDIYEQAFAVNFQPETTRLELVLDDLESSGMGISDKKRRDQLLDILLLYESQKYDQASIRLQEHLNTFSNDFDARFYYGVVLLEIKDYEKAKDQFQKLLNNSTKWEKEATWYLALSQLIRKKDRQEAIRLFRVIVEDKDSPYQSRAAKMIQDLKN